MNAAEAAELVERVDPRVAVPIHYEGWTHFREGRAEVERRAPPLRPRASPSAGSRSAAPTDV